MADQPACLDAHLGDCDGAVEYRHPLSPTGRSFPRCAHHWDRRLAWQAEHNRRFPDSPTPPDWFDPLAAGERWDEDDPWP
jgi:hypothetical protein